MAPNRNLAGLFIHDRESDGFTVIGSYEDDAQNIGWSPRSSSDEEEGRIHLQASKEKRGFRSAKSLNESIAKKRKVKR
jgi:hypothetical protein